MYGYRTNEDGSETLAYTINAEGRVDCVHLGTGCCQQCVDADERLVRRRGTIIVSKDA